MREYSSRSQVLLGLSNEHRNNALYLYLSYILCNPLANVMSYSSLTVKILVNQVLYVTFSI